jgi:hypothetical protein
MAWIDLANNQMVSFTDAQTSGIALKSGQSHVTSNECMTKTQIQAKYNVLTAPMDSFASNQLVEKEKWASASTTTTTTVAPTTTTTTTLAPTSCTLYTFTVDELDLLDAAGNTNPEWNGTVFFRYEDCENIERVEAISDPSSADYCVSSDSPPISITYYNNDIELDAVYSTAIDTELPCSSSSPPVV